MASFEKAIIDTFRAEGGFQNDPTDTANYVNGVLIGTNRGISAQGYAAFYGHAPTVEQMRSLSADEAKKIFKGNYWDKVNGDRVVNQSVAEMMFQYVIGSGLSQISDLKDIANAVYGSEYLKETDVPISNVEVEHINSLDQKKYHEALFNWRWEWYNLVVKRNPAKEKYLTGWRSRLNKHVFVK